jgi:hypothetical protein
MMRSRFVIGAIVPVDILAVGDRLLDPEYDIRPTVLCRKLSPWEAIAGEAWNGKAIAKSR